MHPRLTLGAFFNDRNFSGIFKLLRDREVTPVWKKTEANKARNHVIGQLHTGTYVVYPNIKVGEFLEYWLEYVMRPEITFTANSYYF